MAASYPPAVKTYTTKEDNVDVYAAAHMNAVQDEVTAIETELGTDVAGSVTDLKTRLAVIISDTGALRNGSSFPGTTEKAMIFFKSDEDTLYARNNADTNWVTIGTAGTAGFQMGAYSSGHGGQVYWAANIFDIGGDATTTAFTAPVTGYYLLTARVDVAPGASASGDVTVILSIVTSNRTYAGQIKIEGGAPATSDHQTITVCVVADMDASDTAYVTTNKTEDASNIDYVNEHFSGIRIG